MSSLRWLGVFSQQLLWILPTLIWTKSAFLLYIQGISGLNLSLLTCYPEWDFYGFPQSFHKELWSTTASFHTHFNSLLINHSSIKCYKGKCYPCNRPWMPMECERLRLPLLLETWVTDGSKVVSLTHWPPFTHQEDSWFSFLLEAGSTLGPQCGWKD
jgi:hypothetical protein